jgi:TonB family protein
MPCVALLTLLVGCVVNRPLELTPLTDPEVQAATRGVPPQSAPPRKIVDVRPRPPREFPRGSHFEVAIEGVIARDGSVRPVRIIRGDNREFTEACVKAVAQWRFDPARRPDGTPVAMWTTFTCNITTR